MNCREYQKLVSLLIDGELDEERTASVEQHMAVCPTCIEFYSGAISLQSDLGSSLDVSEPSDLAFRVKAAITPERERASHIFLLPRWVQAPLVAALVIAAVGVGGLAGRSLSGIIQGGDSQSALEMLVPAPDPSFAQVLSNIASLENSP